MKILILLFLLSVSLNGAPRNGEYLHTDWGNQFLRISPRTSNLNYNISNRIIQGKQVRFELLGQGCEYTQVVRLYYYDHSTGFERWAQSRGPQTFHIPNGRADYLKIEFYNSINQFSFCRFRIWVKGNEDPYPTPSPTPHPTPSPTPDPGPGYHWKYTGMLDYAGGAEETVTYSSSNPIHAKFFMLYAPFTCPGLSISKVQHEADTGWRDGTRVDTKSYTYVIENGKVHSVRATLNGPKCSVKVFVSN